MAYAAFSVVFGEQPSAAKWNILGTNDSSFNDGTGIANLAWNTTSLSNPYKFRAWRNAAANSGNGAFSVIAMDSENYDTNNNHSAGVYTVPVTGFYQFNWGSTTTTSGAELFIDSLFKNGTEVSRGTGVVISGASNGSHGSDIISCVAADTLDTRAFNSATRALGVGSDYLTFFSGYIVSRT